MDAEDTQERRSAESNVEQPDLDEELALDIEALEQELAAEFADEPAQDPKPAQSTQQAQEELPEEIRPVPLGNGKKPKKEDLIGAIMRLQEVVDDYEPQSISSYRRMKVADLQQIVAELQNKGIAQFNNNTPQPKDGEAGETAEEAKARIAQNIAMSDRFVAKAMFSMHLTLCQFLEIGSIKVEDRVGTNLVGLVDDSLDNRETLQDALVATFHENKDWLEPMIRGSNRYLFCLATMSANRAFANKKSPPSQRPGEDESERSSDS